MKNIVFSIIVLILYSFLASSTVIYLINQKNTGENIIGVILFIVTVFVTIQILTIIYKLIKNEI